MGAEDGYCNAHRNKRRGLEAPRLHLGRFREAMECVVS